MKKNFLLFAAFLLIGCMLSNLFAQVAPENGAYHFYPRLAVSKFGIENLPPYLAKVEINGEFANFYLTSEPEGNKSNSFSGWNNAKLQDLDFPINTYLSIDGKWADDHSFWIMTFKNIAGKRFKLWYNAEEFYDISLAATGLQPAQPNRTKTCLYAPRLQAQNNGTPAVPYLGKVTKYNEYTLFYLTSNPNGNKSDNFSGWNSAILTDLDNPINTYTSVHSEWIKDSSYWVLCFKNVEGNRFKLFDGSVGFSEIIICE